jgi:two-component system sensor kinase FixL
MGWQLLAWRAWRLIRTRYGIAVLATAIAGRIRFSLNAILAGQASHIFFVPAILVASALGGWAPGILATVLGLLGGIYFVADFRSVLPGDIINAFVFAAVGVGASWRGELLRRSRLAAAASAEEALAREAHVKSILDTIPDAMVVVDERGAVQSFSAAAERLFGYSSADVVGKNVKMLMPSPYRESHDGYIGRYLRTGERRIIGVGRIVVASARIIRHFRSNSAPARYAHAINVSSPGSFVISPNASIPKRSCRNYRPNSCTCRA